MKAGGHHISGLAVIQHGKMEGFVEERFFLYTA
jgi:hypothetical protein